MPRGQPSPPRREKWDRFIFHVFTFTVLAKNKSVPVLVAHTTSCTGRAAVQGKSGQIYFPELTQSFKNGFRFLGYDVQQGKGRAMRLPIASFPMPKRAKADAEFGRKLTLRQTQAVAQLCNVNFFRAVGLSGDRLALVEVNGLTQTFRDAVICFCHEISPVRYEPAHLPIWPTRYAPLSTS